MPYVKLDYRNKESLVNTSGKLNYSLTDLILNYIKENGLNYQSINDIIGAFEGAKMEFYRRVVIPYKDQKIRENGDVYPDSIAPRID